jgi:hypothetical protein
MRVTTATHTGIVPLDNGCFYSFCPPLLLAVGPNKFLARSLDRSTQPARRYGPLFLYFSH